jgi:hypothetical protein
MFFVDKNFENHQKIINFKQMHWKLDWKIQNKLTDWVVMLILLNWGWNNWWGKFVFISMYIIEYILNFKWSCSDLDFIRRGKGIALDRVKKNEFCISSNLFGWNIMRWVYSHCLGGEKNRRILVPSFHCSLILSETRE